MRWQPVKLDSRLRLEPTVVPETVIVTLGAISSYVSVMAQELAHVLPAGIVRGPEVYLRVNYHRPLASHVDVGDVIASSISLVFVARGTRACQHVA